MGTYDRNRAKIAKAALYIEDNLTVPLRASEIAEHAHLSPYHFQRLFYAYLGEPIGQYIGARRLEWAASKLAKSSDMNLLRLALDCGFQTHSAFSRAFRKQFGVSPSAFRNDLKAPNMELIAIAAISSTRRSQRPSKRLMSWILRPSSFSIAWRQEPKRVIFLQEMNLTSANSSRICLLKAAPRTCFS
jgi:AraC-like DNA-binding protein